MSAHVLAFPNLSRAFVCSTCGQAIALDYDLASDRQPVPATFDCPSCEAGHVIDLPGTLKRVRKAA